MIGINGTFRQVETSNEIERDFPLVIENQAFTTHTLTFKESEDSAEKVVAVLTRPGSQEEQNMNTIAEINDEAIEKGEDPLLDFSISGQGFWPNRKRMEAEHGKHEEEKEAFEKLSLNDEEYEPADIYVIATSVEETDVKEASHVTFTAEGVNIYASEIEAGVSKRTGKEYKAFTAYSIQAKGWNPGRISNPAADSAVFAKGAPADAMNELLETQITDTENQFLANNNVAGLLKFKEVTDDNGDFIALEPKLCVTFLLTGIVVTKKVKGQSAPVSKKELSPTQQAAKQRARSLTASRKAKATEFEGEDF